MRYLVKKDWLSFIKGNYSFTVLHDYPSFVLVETSAPFVSAPQQAVELLSETIINVHGIQTEIPEAVFNLGVEPHVLVRFIGPMAPQWQTAMAASGVQVLFWCPPFGACLKLPEGWKEQTVRQFLPFIAGIQPYTEKQSSRYLTPQNTQVREGAGIPPDLLDIVCFSRSDRARVEDELTQLGIEIIDSSSTKIRVRYTGDIRVIRDIGGVKLVDAARGPLLLLAPVLQNPRTVADVLQINPLFDGSDQIIAITDTGLDTGQNNSSLHRDFMGRVIFLKSWPVNPSWNSYLQQSAVTEDASDCNSGHGTHVAGLALGNGSRSAGKHRGIAPAAKLVFQAIEQFVKVKPEAQTIVHSGYYLAGRPLNLRELFQEAYDQGARIHANAWGDPARGIYTDDCYECDLFLSEHKDYILLFAAGNEGADTNGDGITDPSSLYSPAAAKNVIAVGAVEGPRRGVGLRGNWGDTFDRQRQRFLNETNRNDFISGEPTRIAPISSAGPTRDKRIKPDVCAPGTNLIAPRSSRIHTNGWGLADPLPFYMYLGGTSMATGVMAGFVALLRQAWQSRLGKSLSGAALKALVILGAQPVINPDTGREEPRYVAGFGRSCFTGSFSAQPDYLIELIDEAQGIQTGEAREYTIQLARPGFLKAVLTWYDPPNEVLVNDLDLSLRDVQGQIIWGNHGVGQAGTPDRVNTIEVISIPAAIPGKYTLHISGVNILSGPQPFALAVAAAGSEGGLQALMPEQDN